MARKPSERPTEDRTKMPESLYKVKGFYAAYDKYTGEEYWATRPLPPVEGQPREWEHNLRLQDADIIALAWSCVDNDREKLKAKGEKLAKYLDYTAWTEYRRDHKPMGFFPLTVLTEHGVKVYNFLCNPKTGLIGRAPNVRGISATQFFLTWFLKDPRSRRWDNKTNQYLERKTPSHPSYNLTADDYKIIRDKLLDSGLVQEVELEIKEAGVKLIIKA